MFVLVALFLLTHIAYRRLCFLNSNCGKKSIFILHTCKPSGYFDVREYNLKKKIKLIKSIIYNKETKISFLTYF